MDVDGDLEDALGQRRMQIAALKIPKFFLSEFQHSKDKSQETGDFYYRDRDAGVGVLGVQRIADDPHLYVAACASKINVNTVMVQSRLSYKIKIQNTKYNKAGLFRPPLPETTV